MFAPASAAGALCQGRLRRADALYVFEYGPHDACCEYLAGSRIEIQARRWWAGLPVSDGGVDAATMHLEAVESMLAVWKEVR